MKKIVGIVNSVVLGVFVLGALVAYRKNPNILSPFYFLALTPYVLALIAVKSREGIAICMVGLLANGLYALIGTGGFIYSVLGHAAMPISAALGSLVMFAVPCSINSGYFVQMLKRLARPPAEVAP